MRFLFVSARTFESWTHSSPEDPGIGGSETSHIEMARRIAARGHSVVSLAPTAQVEPGRYIDGVYWHEVSGLHVIDYDQDITVVYRAPAIADLLREGANAWLICQDVDYNLGDNVLTPERARKFSRIVALCETHAAYLKSAHPEVADRVCVSSNGIKLETIERIAANPPARIPTRLIYASSPDRGLENLLMIFSRAKEIMPELSLELYYGFDNMDKVIAQRGPKHQAAQIKERLLKLMSQPGVTWHGRTGQSALLMEWFKSGIWCHPSNFTETSCITCMDAQASGAIPITQPVWAIAENVKHGLFVDGNVSGEVVRARYAREIVRLASDPEEQECIRSEMMPWARKQFGWERFVDQWIEWAADDITRVTLERELEAVA